MADIDIAVIGAGIAGLTTAYRLTQEGHRVEVFESEDAPGGRMRSSRVDGYTTDRGAETISPYGYPATWEFIRELGLDRGNQIHQIEHPVGLWDQGRNHPWVGHPKGMVLGAGLSVGGRVQSFRSMLGGMRRSGQVDPEWPENSKYGNMTLAEFGERYGQEMVERSLAPIAHTAFGWQPEVSAVAPLLAIMQGTKGIFRWQTYRDGQDTMARTLASRVKVHLSRSVERVVREGEEVRVHFADGTDLTARAAVLTQPSPEIPSIHPGLPDDERPFIEASTFTTMMRVAVRLDRPLEPRRDPSNPRSYAVVLGPNENSLFSGCTIEHNKCPDRVPAGRGLVTLLISPRRVHEVYDLPDEEVLERALDESTHFIDGLRSAYVGHHIVRWPNGLPAAPPAALRLRGRFVRRSPRPIEYAGDWLYLRPSSEAAIASSKLAVDRVHAWLSGQR
ncbi:FAD-dependent oxidoreductase [Streptomyces sp. AC536]|uniref:protoporphyrinogen/coproporphyrinogen oxidase n=1 Tax=Streptomyces buecherae TaxID=2763006 RepID=UPI00164D676E|nr:FAD-dependent oxidoreductase [Streptomyces buecherae]MBC3984779.1 FAD-dependent oxidoreductase [Streptomyces buecherae]QNJ40115.1 FAD-dependent oxidoreductase [Streptomyces buecherae]